jgi:hypothetical protein
MPHHFSYLIAGEEGVSDASRPVTTGGTGAVIEITVHGRWSRRLGDEVTTEIRRRFAAHPRAVIIDLRDLSDPDGASLPLWLAARRAATVVRPPVQLALCLHPATVLDRRLRRIGAHRLPRFTTVPDARAAMTGLLAASRTR